MGYLRNIALWLDEGINVVIIGFIGLFEKIAAPAEGNAHYTVSEVLAELRNRGSKIGCVGCKILSIIFRVKDHCADAMKGVPENIEAG